jgi:hypothetical protein
VCHNDIDTETIKDWSKVVVPFYSWHGCGGVYLLKIFPNYVLCSDCGSKPFAKVFFDSTTHEMNNKNDEYDVSEIYNILQGAEMQTIRKLYISSLINVNCS